MMLARAAQFGREPLRPEPVSRHANLSPLNMDVSEPWLNEALLMLRRRMGTVLGSVAAALLLATAYLIAVPPKYTASAVVLVDPRAQRVLSSEAVLPGVGQDVAAVESQVEILSSNGLSRRVVEKLKLDTDPEYTSGGLLTKLLDWTGLNHLLKTLLPQRALPAGQEHNQVVSTFEHELDVRRRGLTYILEISFTSKNPEKSALVANEIADMYIAEQVSAKRDATSDASDWLSSRIDDLRTAVRKSEQAVADFKTRNNIVDIGALGSGQTLNQRQIEDVNAKLIAANARTAEATARSTQLEQAAGDPKGAESLTEAMASRVLASLRVQHSTIAVREAELGTQLQPQHPALAAVRSQRLEVERKMKEELGRVAGNTRSELEVARNYQMSLKGSLAGLEEKNTMLANLRVRLGDLEREADANRNLYSQFLARQKDTGEQKGIQKADARVVSRAFAPVRPSSPGPGLLYPLGGLLGLGLGLGLALLKEKRDASYRTTASIEADTGVTCFGICPLVPKDIIVADEEDANSPLQKGISAVLLGFFTSNDDPVSKTLLITSANDDEGKSTIAAGLSKLLTQFNSRTLLVTAAPPVGARAVDSVLRRPVKDRGARLELDTFFKHGELLFSISPASGGSFADQVKFARKLSDFLKEHADSFDFVLIDGPALLSYRDKNMLSDIADSILLVVEWGRTTQSQLRMALESLGPEREKIIGTVLNKVDETQLPYYEPSYKAAV